MYLLDTHVIIWALDGAPQLSATHRDILASDEPCVISVVSLWEMFIKIGIGKLDIRDDYLSVIEDTGFAMLDIAYDHTLAIRALPLHHRDPFDRMLVAQAQVEGLTILSTDSRIKSYGVEVI